MSSSTLLAAGLQLLIPAALLVWLWRRHPAAWSEWVIGTVMALSVIVALSLVLPWLVVPWPVHYLYVLAGLALAGRSWRRRSRSTTREGPKVSGLIRRTVFGVVASVALSTSGVALAGRYVPTGPVIDLACPFQSGAYLVVSGGSQSLINAHLATLEPVPRFVPWRGQSYGIDLVKVNGFGQRAFGFASADPADYRIHGQPVLAPCAGVVVSAVNDRPDMTVGMRDSDRAKLAGNHVVIACGDVEVLLAHMRRDSVRVAVDNQVEVGQILGEVGNSGNTDEPHLHVSAQRRATGQPLFGGTPVWFTIAGRFLVRNDRLSCNAS